MRLVVELSDDRHLSASNLASLIEQMPTVESVSVEQDRPPFALLRAPLGPYQFVEVKPYATEHYSVTFGGLAGAVKQTKTTLILECEYIHRLADLLTGVLEGREALEMIISRLEDTEYARVER